MKGPLNGLTVIDLSRAVAGPHAAMMLGDLGARVIKIEYPQSGDDTRGWGPPFVGPSESEESTYFLSANRNKESVELDLKSDDGIETLRAMVRRADVLIENFRPGVLERLGFGVAELESLNSRLVVLSISGFGHDGPEGGRAGYDQIAQGEAGLMSLTGPSSDEPQRVGVPIADILAGMNGAFGVLAALRERDSTGQGQVVRTSLLAAVVGAHSFEGTRFTVGGDVGVAQGNHHPTLAPYGLFAAADGALQIAVGNESLWSSFCRAVGIDENDVRFTTNALRVQNREALIATIEASFAGASRATLLSLLTRAGVPAGIVRTLDDVYAWPQTRSQGLVIGVDHQTLGPIELPGPPLRFFTWGGSESTKIDHAPPPVLGQHNDSVRAWIDSASGDGA